MQATKQDLTNHKIKNKFGYIKIWIKSWKFWLSGFLLLVAVWLLASIFLLSQASVLVFGEPYEEGDTDYTSYFLEYASENKLKYVEYEQNFVKNKAGEKLSLWWFEDKTSPTNRLKPNQTPEKSDKVFLYLHGRGGRIDGNLTELTQFGNVLSVAYPGIEESEGSPISENVYEASTLAFDWLVETKKVAPENIVIVGYSLGGSPAVQAKSLKLIG